MWTSVRVTDIYAINGGVMGTVVGMSKGAYPGPIRGLHEDNVPGELSAILAADRQRYGSLTWV